MKVQNNTYYIFLFVAAFFLFHIVYIFFTADIKLQWANCFIDFLLGSLFLLAVFRLDYAFFVSLFLMPIFFILENLPVLSQVYQAQSSVNFSFYAVDPRIIGFVATIFFACLFLFNKKQSFFTAPLSKVIPLAIGFFCLSALWSIGQQEKYVQVSFYILLAILYFAAYFSVRGYESFYKLLAFMMIFSIPVLLLSYYQIFGGIFYEYADMEIKRISGPFDSPNLLGSFLLINISLALILLLIPKKVRELKYNNLLIAYLMLIIPIFILTFSRSAWIGLVVFLGVFSLQRKRFFAGVVLVFTLVVSLMFMFEVTRERISGFSQRTMFDSVYARENIWRLSYQNFKEKPLLGYGAGSFAEVINDAKGSNSGTENPHNDIVFFAVEGGLVGVALFLSVMFSFYFYLFKVHLKIKQKIINKSDGDRRLYIISLGILALFFAMTVISLVESYYEGNFIHLFTWSLLAGWLALAQKKLLE